FVLRLLEGGGIEKSFPHLAALQQPLLEEPVERSHDRGVSKAVSKFGMEFADAHLPHAPNALHQFRFQRAQLLQRRLSGSGLSLQPHAGQIRQDSTTEWVD